MRLSDPTRRAIGGARDYLAICLILFVSFSIFMGRLFYGIFLAELVPVILSMAAWESEKDRELLLMGNILFGIMFAAVVSLTYPLLEESGKRDLLGVLFSLCWDFAIFGVILYYGWKEHKPREKIENSG